MSTVKAWVWCGVSGGKLREIMYCIHLDVTSFILAITGDDEDAAPPPLPPPPPPPPPSMTSATSSSGWLRKSIVASRSGS